MKETVLEKLQELNIAYKVVEHTPVYTIEEMDNLGNIFEGAKICKNLFVRDQKGKRHFLIVVPEEKRVPLAEVTEKIGSTKLSFASEERLMKYLKLTPGAVSPLAVINDESNEVEVVLDEELKGETLLGVHPCVNTATVLLAPQELESYIQKSGNKIKYIKI
jgi:Ala-tRNA(Pro) deacylase